MNKLACLFALAFAALFFGCSGSAEKNPVEPSSPLTTQVASTTNRHLWGIWDVSINADRTSVEIAPMRAVDMHLNVVKLLEVKPCSTCLTISNLQITGPNELSADLTLIHPFPGLIKYTGFDVRGIFISTADFTFPESGRQIALGDTVPRMLDPDGYTPLFNPTEFPPTTPAALGYIPGLHATGGDLSATLNPFIAYRKDKPRRMFEAGVSDTETVKIYAPTGPIHFGYAVDACWQFVENVIDPVEDFPPDANCLEPYEIDVEISPGLEPFAGSSAPIEVEVYDHQGQGTIAGVSIESPDLFAGEISLTYSTTMPDGGFLFAGIISNDLGAAEGEYPLLVRATDTQTDQNFGAVAAWQVSLAIVSPPKGWARTWGGTGWDRGFSVAIDATGNTYVTGQFADTVDFDPGSGVDNHTSNDLSDIFLTKFDPSGNFIWARTWGGSDLDEGQAVAIDGSGNVYVTGWFNDAVDFDPGAGVDEHTSNDQYDAFISKFDPNGEFMWARTWGGFSTDLADSVTIDGSGDVYIAGWFWDIEDTDFDPGAGEDFHKSYGEQDAFLSKFDSNGNFIWARTWGADGRDDAESVAIDGFGNAYIEGHFEDTVDFDPGAGVDDHASNDGRDIYLSKLDLNGNFIWARTWGGAIYNDDDNGTSVAIDGFGNAYVTGFFFGTADFDPGAGVDDHASNGLSDDFLSKFDPNGNLIWARTWGGNSSDQAMAVAIDDSGNVYVSGSFFGSVDFDPGAGVDSHESNGNWDAFLSKFDLDGNFIWVRAWGGIQEDRGMSVGIDCSGSVLAGGWFSDTVDFDPGLGLDDHTSEGIYDAFLCKFLPDGNW